MAQSDDRHKVQVHIYDLSKGMATALSLPLLGKQIDGVWHTGIVVFGMEYFFGSAGISHCEPGRTILGDPDKVKDLGHTCISHDIFMDFLYALSNDQFSSGKYNLFEHNCNTFSDEVALFLTGNRIPSYIIDLPAEVANTPLGSMMKSMTNNMSLQPGGGTTLFNSVNSPAPSSQPKPTSVTQNSTPKRKSDSDIFSSITYAATEPFPEDNAMLATVLIEAEKNLLDEIYYYLTSGSSGCSLGKAHLKMLVNQVTSHKANPTTAAVKCEASSLLQALVLNKGIMEEFQKDQEHIMASLLLEFTNLPHKVMIVVLKMITNCCSSKTGLKYLTSTKEFLLSSVQQQTCSNGSFSYLALTREAVVNGLLLEQCDINNVAAAAVFNMHQMEMHEDLLIALASALIQCLQHVEIPEETAFLGLQSLKWFIKISQEICALVKMMELNYQCLSLKSPRVKSTCEQINIFFSEQGF